MAGMQAEIDASHLGDPTFDGYYVQAGYFLTGEHRPYVFGRGGFGRVKPKSIFGKDDGRGAWEIAARYSTLDLTDGAVDRAVDASRGESRHLAGAAS